jgi:SAM-dependent methyltransferase
VTNLSCLAENAFPDASDDSLECLLCMGSELEILSEYAGKQLQRCCDCGVSFVIPQPGLADLITHFEDGGLPGCEDLASKFEINRERVLTRVACYIRSRKKGGRMLDVGCATGLFLADFSRNGSWQTWGAELSPWAAEKARARGIRVHEGELCGAGFATDWFDVITVLDVLYYFRDPQSQLAECRRALKPDGLLVVELPLGDSRIWRTSDGLGRILSRTWRPLLATSDHLFYYNPRSIARLLQRSGFKVEAILPLPGNRQTGRMQEGSYRGYWLLSRLLHRMSGSRIFLGPRFLVAAVKQPAT